MFLEIINTSKLLTKIQLRLQIEFNLPIIDYLCVLKYKLYYDALPAINVSVEPMPQEPQPIREVKCNKEIEDEIAKLKLYLQQGVVLADYAVAIKVSERKLSAFINSTYGKSFNKWVNTQRVEYAKKLVIDNPELKIEQVAEQSGFADKSQFSKIFKDITQMTFISFKTTGLHRD